MTPPEHEIHLPIIGARITPLTANHLSDILSLQFEKREKFVIANHNLHSLYLYESNDSFRKFVNNARYVLIDGFPVLALARLVSTSRLSRNYRIGSLDWIERVVKTSEFRRIAVVGSSRSANSGAIERIRLHSRSATFRGFHGEEWNPVRAKAVAEQLADFAPDLTLVGLGMPLQEEFLSDHWHILPASVYATVGGALDQLSGVQKPAPRWLGAWGLEWLWRLITQPRRLSYRYLVEPWKLVGLLLRRKVGSTRKSRG